MSRFEQVDQRHDSASVVIEANHGPQALLPDESLVDRASSTIQRSLPSNGQEVDQICNHLKADLAPALNQSSLSPTYYGFVTGGVTPAAHYADNLVTSCDQNVSVHLPRETIATTVEDNALCMLLELLDFEPSQWCARSFTTGATASNILGLACGREFGFSRKLACKGQECRLGESILSLGMRTGVKKMQILTTMPHSSLGKAANIAGIGSDSMIDVSKQDSVLEFDMTRLETHLSKSDALSIVVISCGEVNTGGFATKSAEEVEIIRQLCDKHGAWLHVDGAFGIFARALAKGNRYDNVRRGAAGLQLVDSITGDAHKLLNVPYDCGFFFSKHRDMSLRVCQNVNAAYLSTKGADDGITSPLNVRLENSARFRGLPVYATLMANGREGYAAMIGRMVDLARKISQYIRDEHDGLELLPKNWYDGGVENHYICVLFRARDSALNEFLTDQINATKNIYASSTRWEGEAPTRFAIAKWNVDVDRDFATVKEVLKGISA